mmetsp:Transcript_26972/g.30851  ORF Transcript_26972/g.30851 Transcript_26972/m.30851 type:complete len:277 (+) Transcript_26972:141-971(+)
MKNQSYNMTIHLRNVLLHFFLFQLKFTTSFTIHPLSNLQSRQNSISHDKQSFSFSTKLYSLKPAALQILDSGKALARSGELLIEYTSKSNYNLYGGGLSAAGASIRTAGDCIAQAGASMRFKTASEIVIDEFREAGTCLLEGSKNHLVKGVDDADVDKNIQLKDQIGFLIEFMEGSGNMLEETGEKIMKRDTVTEIGSSLVNCSDYLEKLALGIQLVGSCKDDDKDDYEKENEESRNIVKESCTRMLYASEKMKEAGNNLQGIEPPKKKGKAWLKA